MGCNVPHNLSWHAHLQGGEKALLGELRKKLGTLKFLSHQLPRKCRKILAEGLIWSKATYLIAVWGGCSPHLYEKIAAVLNNTSRFVTGDGKRTRKSILLKKFGWLDVQETAKLHMGVMMWNILRRGAPSPLARKFTLNEDSTVTTDAPRLLTTTMVFRWKGVALWNNISQALRENLSLPSFKKDLKKWLIAQRAEQEIELH